jgi:ATP-binding cassette, subfamily B, bacterial PglK
MRRSPGSPARPASTGPAGQRDPGGSPSELGLLRRVWGLLAPGLRRRVIWLVPLLLLGSVFELLGISAIYPVLLLILTPDWTEELPQLVGVARGLGLDPVEAPERFRSVVLLAVAGVFAGRTAYLVWLKFWIPDLLGRIRLALATLMLERYLGAAFSEARDRTTARMQHLVSHQTYMITFEYLYAIAEIASAGALALGVFSGLLWLDPTLVWAGGVVLGVVALLVWSIVGPVSRRLGDRYRLGSERMLFEITQTVGAIRETKLMQRGPFFLERFREPGARVTFAMARQYGLGGVPSMVIETSLALVGIGALAFVDVEPNAMGGLLARVGMLVVAVLRFVPFVNRILRSRGRITYAETSVRTFLHELDQLAASTEPIVPTPESERLRLEDRIECRDLCFAYRAGTPVLDRIDLILPRGELVAFVGASGAGKSTLVDLLCGLLRPTSGQILVDGRDLRGREPRWWPSVSYVQQTPFLLDGTLEENVAFGVPPDDIDRDRVRQVLDRVRLSDLVDCHPQGLAQPVGERGGRLSGGQRQRIGIARALYQQADVLIFDEATANLDAETEGAISEILHALRGERTVWVIAHRLHSVQRMDRVVFMEAGRIAAQGAFGELIRISPAFARMTRAQAIETPVP